MHNNIPFIQKQGGARIEQHEEIKEEFLNYFKQVHQEPNADRRPAIERITQNVPKFITEEHNELLLQPILTQEVDTAMSQLKEGKAPGPDGFTTTFFHTFWELIKLEVWQVVEESRALHWLLPSLNSTFIALIPKEEESNTLEKFRPIALCNVIYKVISKVIANRLKPLLPLLISPEQSGYVEGRQILDGIILSHEIIHSLKYSKQASMILKLDLSKAFDKLSWTYIQKMLIAFGVSHMWTRWIMSLITSSFFSILVNGIPSRPFSPSRGIRQGDPLSPFLFVLMAEGLRCHIKQALLSHQLKGLSIHNSPAIRHQQFVDDNMLFGYPSVQEASRFKSLLNEFSEALGTSINNSKSQIFFFHTPPIFNHAVARILGFPTTTLPAKYLGAPLIASAIKHSSWHILIEKLESRLNLWTYITLNMAGSVVLIKPVLQAMSLYLFSILAAPKWVLKRIRDLQRGFLWGNSATNRKWALVKWTTVCTPKKKRGIGLRDPNHSNAIMSAKIWWQWLSSLEEPWAAIWTTKYANHRPQEELIRFTPNVKGSLIWNAAKQHFQLIQQHSFWEDWTQEIEQGFRKWKQGNQITRIADIPFIDDLEKELRKRSIRHSEGRDILQWGYKPKGTFTTSEAYKIMCIDLTTPDPIWSKIWGLGSWPKVSFFLWLVGHQRILTWDKLRRRNYHGPSIYVNSKSQEETIHHLLDACPLANQLWEKASFRCQRRCRLPDSITKSLRHWQMNPYKSGIHNHLWNILPGLLLWSIWKEMNKRIFKDQCSSVEIIWSKLCVNLKETLLLRSWTTEDLPTLDNDKAIWENWNMQIPHEPHNKVPPKSSNTKKVSWTAPPKLSFKLNFDGASKGNPGIAGFGRIFRNDKGLPLLIYCGNIGWDTNNSTELEGLWQGPLLSRNHSFHPLEVEGDSQILINMAKHLLNGSHAKKIATSWRLEARLEAME
eukprot:PITA_25694